MIKSFLKLVRFTWAHQLNQGGRIRALSRIFRWQIASRLLPEASFLLPFVGEAGLLVRRGMTGATGNWYCGLDEINDMGLVLHALRPGELFIDVGSNIGSYSILAAAGAKANVIAIEPISQTFSNLSLNIRVNDLSSLVTAHCVGLSERPGTLTFSTSLDSMNHVLADGEEVDSQVIKVTTMDLMCEEKSPVVIKIDVEGHELSVLLGAENTMNKPSLLAVIIELNGSGLRYGIDDVDIDAWMIRKGFQRCEYSSINRRLTRRLELPKMSGNQLYVRDIDMLEQRLITATRVAIINGVV